MAKRKSYKKSDRPNTAQIREDITNKMVEAIKGGMPPWRKPWSGAANFGFPTSVSTGKRYNGINVLLLYLMGYDSKFWGTGHAWKEKTGAYIRAGEQSQRVVYWQFIDKKDPKTGKVLLDDNGKPQKFPMLRLYSVFNVEQIAAPDVSRMEEWKLASLLAYADEQGIEVPRTGKAKIARAIHDAVDARLAKYRCVEGEDQNSEPDFAPAEELMTATGAKIRHGGTRAFYRPTDDFIQLPPKKKFESMSRYYETAMHELTHWCEAPSRVGKVDGHTYAWGELVAEMGACFVCAALGVPAAEEMLEHSASYVEAWLKEMGGDPKYIFDAASQASKTSDFLLSQVGLAEKSSDSDSESSEQEPKPKSKPRSKPRSKQKAA